MSISMQLRSKKYLVIFAALVFSFVAYYSFGYINSLPKKITKYQDISLGNSKDEVFYVLGVPNEVLFPPEKISQFKGVLQRFATKDEIKKNPSGEKGFDSWQYNKKGFRVDIDFDPQTGKVESIGCFISIKKDFADINTCKVNGIRALDTEERVVDVLGKPDSSQISGVTKELSYPSLNMRIIFEQKFAYFIAISNKFSN
jgi:hypothetical protein